MPKLMPRAEMMAAKDKIVSAVDEASEPAPETRMTPRIHVEGSRHQIGGLIAEQLWLLDLPAMMMLARHAEYLIHLQNTGAIPKAAA